MERAVAMEASDGLTALVAAESRLVQLLAANHEGLQASIRVDCMRIEAELRAERLAAALVALGGKELALSQETAPEFTGSFVPVAATSSSPPTSRSASRATKSSPKPCVPHGVRAVQSGAGPVRPGHVERHGSRREESWLRLPGGVARRPGRCSEGVDLRAGRSPMGAAACRSLEPVARPGRTPDDGPAVGGRLVRQAPRAGDHRPGGEPTRGSDGWPVRKIYRTSRSVSTPARTCRAARRP